MKIHKTSLTRRGTGRNARRGATMVEFAFTFAAFIMLIIGTIEGGRMIWTWASVSHATREGARYAMVHGEDNPVGDDVIQNYVKNRALGLDTSGMTVNVTWSDPDKVAGSRVAIDTRYRFQFVVPPMLIGPSRFSLRSRTDVIVAN